MKGRLNRWCCFLLLFILVCPLAAQELKGGRYGSGKGARRSSSAVIKRNKTDVFPLDRIYKLGGPLIAPGITYTFPRKATSESIVLNDTTESYASDPSGKIGLYLELGWFHAFVNPRLFHFMDFGVSYKQLKGEESIVITRTDAAGNLLSSVGETRNFSDQFLTGHFNLTHHRHFSRYGFVNNSIGVNVDYAFSTSRSGVATYLGSEQEFPETLTGQLHYKLGIGWKASPQLLVIPSVETPLLTVYPFDGLKSTLPYFYNRYRPVIFSIRFLFIRKDPENCNVPSYDGPKNFD